MNRSLRIFFACAFGAVVGSIIALSISRPFWFVGMFTGGITSYLSFEFKQVVFAFKKTLRETIYYKPNWPYWKRYGLAISLSGAQALSSFTVFIYIITTNTKINYETSLSMLSVEDIIFCTGVLGGALGLVLGGAGFLTILGEHRADWEHTRLFTMKTAWVTPAAFLLATLLFVPAIAVLLVIALVKWRSTLPKFLMRLCGKVFYEIHSDIRVLCAFDAAIGTAIGYYFDNPIIGGISGGLLGVIHYKIVSKRPIELTPH